MGDRWILGLRWIPGVDEDRARVRATLAFRFTPEFQAGLEWNPLADDLGPIANWRVMDETEKRPALILGTSSDRIGTPRGRSYYATLSKDLEQATGLPIAPYAGVSYGEFDEELVGIGGMSVRWAERWTSFHMWDGHNFHNLLETRIGERFSLGVLLVDVDGELDLGVTFGASFRMPWEGE